MVLEETGMEIFSNLFSFSESMVQDACHCSPKSYHMQPVEKKKGDVQHPPYTVIPQILSVKMVTDKNKSFLDGYE